MKKQQIQQQITLSAYERKTVHDLFLRTMNWLEKYIEITGYYPDWEKRKQLHNDWIKRTDIDTPEKAEKALSNRLIAFGRILDSEVESDSPFLEELKAEFYQWINVTGIDVNNCPERLKHFVFGFNEILEGRLEKIEKDSENKKQKLDTDAPGYLKELTKVFVDIQEPIQNEREVKESLAGKTHLDIEIENKFGGNVEQGEQTFNLIASAVSVSHGDNFHFFPQQTQQQSTSLTDDENSDIIRNVQQNRNFWKIETIQGQTWLIHSSAQGTDSEVGTLIHNRQRFTDNEWGQIQQVINASQQQQAQQQQQSYQWSWDKK